MTEEHAMTDEPCTDSRCAAQTHPASVGHIDEPGELERLRRWKAEATEVILGLQDVGKALGLRLGESITGATATEAAKRLTERAESAEAALTRVRAHLEAVVDLVGPEPLAAHVKAALAALDGA